MARGLFNSQTIEARMQFFSDLFDQSQLAMLEEADLIRGKRHPTWYPLFYKDRVRTIDHLTQEAIAPIARQSGGKVWLKGQTSPLTDFLDIRNASAALAEIRAYGGLLAAGFKVEPIIRQDDTTPDFTVDAGDGMVTVEVFSKHQDVDQDKLLDAVHSPDGTHPAGIERRKSVTGNYNIAMTITSLTPGGRPNTNKAGDSVQANVISRMCAMKKDERQIREDRPALLIADLTHFGPAAEMVEPTQAAPLLRGHRGLCSGGMWYGMYGWKDAPIFEEMMGQPVHMGHDGRFRLADKDKSRLSGVLFIFHQAVVLLENPWATHRLPDKARKALTSYPWFDLVHSVGDWRPGDAEKLIAVQRSMIEAF
jgi:hypothetical protein